MIDSDDDGDRRRDKFARERRDDDSYNRRSGGGAGGYSRYNNKRPGKRRDDYQVKRSRGDEADSAYRVSRFPADIVAKIFGHMSSQSIFGISLLSRRAHEFISEFVRLDHLVYAEHGSKAEGWITDLSPDGASNIVYLKYEKVLKDAQILMVSNTRIEAVVVKTTNAFGRDAFSIRTNSEQNAFEEKIREHLNGLSEKWSDYPSKTQPTTEITKNLSTSEEELMSNLWIDLVDGLDWIFERRTVDPYHNLDLNRKMFLYFTSRVSGHNTLSTTVFVACELYQRLENYVAQVVRVLHEKAAVLSGEELLRFYSVEWDRFIFSAKVMDGICAYLNRHWIRREQDEGRCTIYMVYTMAVYVFKRDLFDLLETKIIDACLELIRLDRNGEKINEKLIAAVVASLTEFGEKDIVVMNKTISPGDRKLIYYKSCFETRFLETTNAFYSAEAAEFLGKIDASCTDYMTQVETRIGQEDDRCGRCLHSSSNKAIADVCNLTMITKQIEFIQSHFGPLLVAQRDEHLARMYKLCCRIADGLNALRSALEQHVIKEGQLQMAKDSEKMFNDPKLYITSLLEVQERYHGLVTQSFQQDSGCIAALDRAAQNFVNQNAVTRRSPPRFRAIKSSELISRYCDQLFKKGAKMPDEREMEVLQDKVLVILRYLEDKDIFLKFYTKMFSKRLINDLSASDEAEQSFISKLTTICGFEYTSRLSKMVSDLQVSKDLTRGYKDSEAESDGKKIEFNALVLSSGSWPNFPECALTLPQNLGSSIESFTNFYSTKYNGRKLQWAYSQCRGEVTCSAFKGKKYVFAGTTPQMCTLLLFNEQNAYTTEQVKMATGMDMKHTQMVVQSLLTNQIFKSDKPIVGGQLPMDASLTLNSSYTNKKVKVDLSRMTMKAEAAKDSEMVQRSADEDRKNVISAAIVRIMKMRKSFPHSQLISEVIDQLKNRFKPKVDMIKRCIGSLIEKEYIRRSEEQREIYEFIA